MNKIENYKDSRKGWKREKVIMIKFRIRAICERVVEFFINSALLVLLSNNIATTNPTNTWAGGPNWEKKSG